jgi:short-subunit dehydrogenase
MVTVFSPVADLTPEEVRRVTEVTYLGSVHGTQAALRRMRLHGRGTIVQVGSALAYRAIPLQAAYCGAKFAMRGFTDALRCELIHNREAIHVTMVQLSAFNTPQFQWARTHIARHPQPLPPIFQPEVAARAIVFAAYARRREVWVGAPAVKTILANRIAPWFLDRYLANKAWDGQMLEEAADTRRPDNLFAPLPGDWGSHGRFDARAKTGSWQLWLTMHPALPAFVLVALVVVGLVLLRTT